MAKWQKILILLSTATLIAGCTDAIPEIESLAAKTKPITFNGQDFWNVNVTSKTQTMALHGECKSVIETVEIKVGDNGAWEDLNNKTTSAAAINCADQGRLSFTLQGSESLTTANWNAPHNYSVYVRGKGAGQVFDDPTQININYTPGNSSNENRLVLSPGGGVKSNGTYTLKARIGQLQGAPISNGSITIKPIEIK